MVYGYGKTCVSGEFTRFDNYAMKNIGWTRLDATLTDRSVCSEPFQMSGGFCNHVALMSSMEIVRFKPIIIGIGFECAMLWRLRLAVTNLRCIEIL